MNSGAYQILLNIKRNIEIKAGALGICRFPAGRYIYTGSAVKNLDQRISRHLKKEKKLHWHIDYLLEDANAEIIEIKRYESHQRIECQINQKALHNGGRVVIKGFGSSDCRECESHLLLIK